jgi:iron complex transport system ATP-binding protein
MEAKLKTKNLSIGYNDKVIVDSINFELSPGDFIVIIGKNGSGKSTLLKTLSNILPKISGDILLNNINFDKLSGKEKSKLVSIVLTEKIDIPLTVNEVLQLGRQAFSDNLDRLSTKDYEIIDKIVLELELKDLLNRPLQELSDGEQQKVMISRTLVQETPIILLDEPTTHLDIENKAKLLNMLKEISNRQNKIVILSTHDINLVLSIANKIWVINNNSFIELNQSNIVYQFEKIFDNTIVKYDSSCKAFRLA